MFHGPFIRSANFSGGATSSTRHLEFTKTLELSIRVYLPTPRVTMGFVDMPAGSFVTFTEEGAQAQVVRTRIFRNEVEAL